MTNIKEDYKRNVFSILLINYISVIIMIVKDKYKNKSKILLKIDSSHFLIIFNYIQFVEIKLTWNSQIFRCSCSSVLEEHHTVKSYIRCLKRANPYFNYTVSAKIAQ